jgi:outer membrane protein OmpA-like peptidoglycan-associated protein
MRTLIRMMLLATLVHVGMAQPSDDERMKVGVFGHARLNLHVADFRQLPGVPCCGPGFDGGSGLGLGIGALVDLPLSERWMLQVRGMYASLGGDLTVDEQRTVNLFGEAVPGVFRHTIDASIGAVGIEALIGYHPVQRLTIGIGPTLLLPITTTYTQTEEIIEPSVGGFDFRAQQRSRTIGSGDLPSTTRLQLAATLQASYDIPLDAAHHWFLTPEFGASLAFINVVDFTDDASSWKVHGLRGGLAVKYAPFRDDGPSDPSYAGALNGSISASGLAIDGTETPNITIRVEEFLTTQMKPLLPYVFFDEGRSDIPGRYVLRAPSTTASFEEQQLHQASMLETYHEILNIIGKRMQLNGAAALTLTGCTSDQGREKGATELARQRAERVKQYLVEHWKIAPERIAIEARGLPSRPSNVNDADGIIENRRVEIAANDPRILDPVWTTDTARTVDPPGVRFRTLATAEAGLASWSVVASQDGTAIKEFHGNDAVPSFIDWNMQDDQRHVPRAPGELDYKLVLRDAAGRTAEADGPSIDVEQRTIQYKRKERIKDKEIDRYALIGFEFADAGITPANARLLDRITSKITLNATIRIDGHTDRIGDADYNKRLSVDRARSVANRIGTQNVSVSGHGDSRLLYDNDLPEGRFYSRTVNIVVETPMNGE